MKTHVEELITTRFLQYWGFGQIPFPKHVTTDQIFRSSKHDRALERLQQVLLTREIGVVVGEAGTGKTTLVADFIQLATDAHYRVIHLPLPQSKVRELYRAISQALGVNTSLLGADAIKVTDLLSYSYVESNRPNLLLIDEAHILPAICLNELRLLTNTMVNNQPLLAMVLFGQPSLASTFKAPGLIPLAQRISAWIYMEGLDEPSTHEYVKWHLNLAGQSDEIFTAGAIKAITRRSQGNPRIINRLAWECLNQACLDDTKVITEELFAYVCKNLGPHLTD